MVSDLPKTSALLKQVLPVCLALSESHSVLIHLILITLSLAHSKCSKRGIERHIEVLIIHFPFKNEETEAQFRLSNFVSVIKQISGILAKQSNSRAHTCKLQLPKPPLLTQRLPD